MEAVAEDGVVGVVGVVEHELAEWAEVALDRVGPRNVGRCEAQLYLFFSHHALTFLDLWAERLSKMI